MGALRSLVEVVFVVDDLERSLAFYRDLLGLTVFSPPEVPVAFLRIGEPGDGIPQQIVLIPRHLTGTSTPPRADGRSLHHIGIEVAPEDFERERERLTAAGITLRTGEHPFLPVDAFYLDDPDGNEVEIACWRG
jgi:catechol 2,3-dioxygenase-like lactoylglutathione lyase family enzyme